MKNKCLFSINQAIPIILGLLFLCINVGFAQSKILSTRTKKALRQTPPSTLSLFTISEVRDSIIDASIKNVVYLKLNKAALAQINTITPKTLSFIIPIDGVNQTILLNQYQIFMDDFKAEIKSESGIESVENPKGIFYRGYVANDDYSIAALSFYENEVGGIISISGKKGNYNLVLNSANTGLERENYILFLDNEILDRNAQQPICEGELFKKKNEELKYAGKGFSSNEQGLSCKTVSIAYYGDKKLYQKNQNNLANTFNYLTTVFNGVATLFENDDIRVALKYLQVNVFLDNYPTTSSLDVLKKFGNNVNTNVTADLMQIVTGYTNESGWPPLGGIAWLDVLCMYPIYEADHQTFAGPFSMMNTKGSANLPSIPYYSWDINCSTHEFGHNLGSRHTHNCAWNGNNTTIDGCGPTYNNNYADVNCPIGPIPTNGGTIMSYCHLLQSIGVNFTNGFGTQPKALIQSRIDTASCLNDAYWPNMILQTSNTTLEADAYCINNNTVYFYNTQADYKRSNDDLILIVENPNIQNLDFSNVTVATTTSGNYNSGAAINASNYNYILGNADFWYHSNRSWFIDFDLILLGTTKITLPFVETDKMDLTGSYSNLNNQIDNLKVVVFKTTAAAQNPSTASVLEVDILDNGQGNNQWNFSSNNNYLSATFDFIGGISGATFGAGNLKGTSVQKRNFTKNKVIKIYPNPSENYINIESLDESIKIQKIELFDYLGRNLKVEYSFNQAIDLSNLSSGIYWIKCYSNKGVFINNFSKL